MPAYDPRDKQEVKDAREASRSRQLAREYAGYGNDHFA